MNEKTNGSLRRMSRLKDIVQNHSKPFQGVLASFEAAQEDGYESC